MGFVEVLRKLPDLFRLRDAFRQVMVERKPDIFVTVDYPDFNMRVAKVAKQLGIPVFPSFRLRRGPGGGGGPRW